MANRLTFAAAAAGLALLVGCGSHEYSPDVYAAHATQQAAKVERGTVVGVRVVQVSADATIGAATGAAAGGIAGAQMPGGSAGEAFGALGGALVGGIFGSATEHTLRDTEAYEYIVQKTNNELVSVTQKDAVPLRLGEKVLVIAGPQARIVRDYTLEVPPSAAQPKNAGDTGADKGANASKAAAENPPSSPTTTEGDAGPTPGTGAAAASPQAATPAPPPTPNTAPPAAPAPSAAASGASASSEPSSGAPNSAASPQPAASSAEAPRPNSPRPNSPGS